MENQLLKHCAKVSSGADFTEVWFDNEKDNAILLFSWDMYYLSHWNIPLIVHICK